MLTKVKKWGNSLAIRIPKSIAESVEIELGEAVNLQIEDGKIVLSPVKKPLYSLESLLENVREEQLHSEVDSGEPVGREIW